MCHDRWWSFHRPWLEHPSKIAPQPMREASVISILRRHEAPNMVPWDRNQGFFHITKACMHCRVTLIMRKGLPHWENPLVLSHHCRGLMYNIPKCIMLYAASVRPNSLWNCLTVSDWPSLVFFTADRMDSIYVPVTGTPALTLSPMPRQEKWSSLVEKSHYFWHLAVTPTLPCGQERNLDAELPTDTTELESTNCRCSSLCEYPEDEDPI